MKKPTFEIRRDAETAQATAAAKRGWRRLAVLAATVVAGHCFAAAPDPSAAPAHRLPFAYIKYQSTFWRGPGYVGAPCRSLIEDQRDLAFGDLNADGREDAAIVCTGEDGHAQYVAAIIMDNEGKAEAFGGWDFGDGVTVRGLAIDSGSIWVTLTPAGSAQEQRVRFVLGRKPGSFNLDMKGVPPGALESDWLSYRDERFGYSFRYPRNVLLRDHYEIARSESRTLESFGGLRIYLTAAVLEDDFLKSAVDAIVDTCELSGEDGNSYGDEKDVEKTRWSSGGLSGYRLSLGCRDPGTRAPNGTVSRFVAFDLSSVGKHLMLTFSCGRRPNPAPRASPDKACEDVLGTFKKR